MAASVGDENDEKSTDGGLNQSRAQNKHCDVRKDTLRTKPAQNRTQHHTNGE
jgi:hypothetical protein